jgi:membrane-bound lytic murein transglycosylase D
MVRRIRRLSFVLALLPPLVGCGASLSTQTPKRAVPAAKAAQPPAASASPAPSSTLGSVVADDPVGSLIAESDRRFKAGQSALEAGHAEAAKLEFDRAIDLLLQSPLGARSEPRLREHFDRLVDRISTYELKALAEGDGFTEKRYEPASIDDLLALTTFDRPVPAELTARVETDLESGSHDIPIPANQRVLAYIELFQGRLHDFIEEGMRRGSQYLPMIQSVFRAEGLPLDLAYVPLVESAFKPNALSRAKAKGVWQFMRGTAVENGLRHDWYVDERSDPEKATIAAAKYLKTLASLFDGDWHLTLASYNGGPGRVQRAVKRVGVDDFWALAAKPRALPRETREYVPMILAAIVIARNPAEYGFNFVAEEQPTFERITLPRPVDLRRVAEWTGTTIDEIQALNPELRRWTTPVREDRYELKVPAGTSEVVALRLQESADVDLASLKWYTVKKGETLPSIARKLGVSRTDLAQANYLSTKSRIAAGQKLMVPHAATVLMAARTYRPVPATESRTTVAQAGELVRPVVASGRVKTTYRVRNGDTLSSIARSFQTSVASLKTWNPRLDGDRLQTGQRLTVYRRAR